MEAIDRRIEEAYNADEDALSVMYRGYAIRLYRLCIAKGLSEQDAEDVCHDTMVKAWNALSRFRFGSPMWPWLARIADNTITDLRRGQRVIPVAELPEPQDEGALARVEAAELVGAAMGNLPSHYVSLLQLREYEGRPYSDIGKVLGMSLPTVRSGLLRARRALRIEVEHLREDLSAIGLLLGFAWSSLRLQVARWRYASHSPEPVLTHLMAAALLVIVLTGPSASDTGDSEGHRYRGRTSTPDPVSVMTFNPPLIDAGRIEASATPADASNNYQSEIHQRIVTPGLSTTLPAEDPVDSSQPRIEIGPVEVWCPYFRDSALVEQTCGGVASIQDP